jgi:hypothetical protein
MLNPSLDIDSLSHTCHLQGRVLIRDILDQTSAEKVYQSLLEHKEWDLCSYGPFSDGAFSGLDETINSKSADNDSYRIVKETTKKSEY